MMIPLTEFNLTTIENDEKCAPRARQRAYILFPTYFSPWKDFTAGLRDLSLICRKTGHLLMSFNGPNGQLCLFIINQPFLSVFIKLSTIGSPVTLIDLISKKRTTNYSTRTCASLIVPRFNTRYMKDSVAFRGSVLWNAVTNNCSALTKNIPHRDLRLKLKSQVNFNEFSFKITSASTCNFRKDDFVYT